MKIASIFSDNMVLQRQKPINVWGEGEGVITVTLNGDSAQCTARDGKWQVELPSREAGGPYDLKIESATEQVVFTNILVGEVWVAGGQSNMEMPLFYTYGGFEAAKGCENDNIRLNTVGQKPYVGADFMDWHFEPRPTADRPWMLCTEDTALSFSAIGYYFAVMLEKYLQVPVGIINCNWGGTKCECWIDLELLRQDEEFAYITDGYDELLRNRDVETEEKIIEDYLKDFNASVQKSEPIRDIIKRVGPDLIAHTQGLQDAPDWMRIAGTVLDVNANPGCLYEAMIAPIAPYNARGFLWYQGESNSDMSESYHYAKLYNLMTECWRKAWGDNNSEMPIIAVELAPFRIGDWNFEREGDNYAYLREQQLLATKTGVNSHMVNIGDIGDTWNIHPCRKKEVAERLFLAACKETYGNDNVEYSGPRFRSMRVENGKCYIKFDHVGEGLKLGEITQIITTSRKVCSWSCVNDVEIAADDGVYKEAETEIVGKDEVCVWSSQVWGEKLNVRMGWRNHQMLNLFNSYGLPTVPFRTDGLI